MATTWTRQPLKIEIFVNRDTGKPQQVVVSTERIADPGGAIEPLKERETTTIQRSDLTTTQRSKLDGFVTGALGYVDQNKPLPGATTT